MKYKLWGAFFCLCAVLLSLAAPLLERQTPSLRYHQHRDAPVKEEQTRGSGFATHLPLVEIHTDGVEIPGKAAFREDGSRYYTTAADGSETILAHMDIVDQETSYNHPGDTPTLSSAITIHVRGRSSRLFEKSSYAIRLVSEDGLINNPQPVMGMDAHHEWVLHGPYLDKSLMRNYMWYNIGGEIMDYAPNVRFCEVMLNGTYQGVYVMLENLTAGNDGARLPLTVSAKNNTFSGYLLQFNGGWESSRAQTNQFSYYTKRIAPMEIVYPGRSNLTPEMVRAISQDFSDFEKALYSYDYDTKQYGYHRYIDTQSFIDYFLINEVTCNSDAGRFSTYIGKDPAGKLHMYLWDMNSSCDNYQEQPMDRKSFGLHIIPWFSMLVKDEQFTDALICRYWELRDTFFDPDYLCAYIDETAFFLGDAVERNYVRWGSVFSLDEPLLTPADRELHSFEEALTQMKDFLRERIAWMDENIDALRQYSAESMVKKYNENTD